MRSVSIKQARNNLRALIDRVRAGEEVVLTRRGKEVARLVPPAAGAGKLPSLREFRASIPARGRAMSAEVIRAREEERA